MAVTLALLCPAPSLFHDPNGTAFADFMIDGHRETWPIHSRQFRHWLRRRYYEGTGSAASADAIRSAVDLLEARAQFDAPERTVHIRIAEHDGRIYLDLADKDWRAVQIGPDGWQVVTSPPVPSCRRNAAASYSAERRIDRSPRSIPQSSSTR